MVINLDKPTFPGEKPAAHKKAKWRRTIIHTTDTLAFDHENFDAAKELCQDALSDDNTRKVSFVHDGRGNATVTLVTITHK